MSSNSLSSPSSSSSSSKSPSTATRVLSVAAAGVSVAAIFWSGWTLYKRLTTPDARTALYSMPAYTQLNLSQAQEIMDTFRVPDQAARAKRRFEVVALKELMGGLSNSNYLIQVRDNAKNGCVSNLLLKICEEKDVDEVSYQLRALEGIRRVTLDPSFNQAAAFPRPCPIAYAYPSQIPASNAAGLDEEQLVTDSSSLLFHVPSITNRSLVFYRYLDGQMIRTPTPQIMHQVAKAQAHLHSVPIHSSQQSDFSFLPPIPFGMFAIRQQYEKQVLNNPNPQPPHDWANHSFIQFLTNGRLQLLDACVRISPSLQESIIHSDLFLENMIFSKDRAPQILGMIDFEEMGRGPRLLDVTMTIVGCCYDSNTNQLNKELARSFVKSYQEFTPFSQLEREQFHNFMVWSLLAIAYWRFQNFNIVHTEPNARKDAYLVMQHRVEELETEQMKALFKEFVAQ